MDTIAEIMRHRGLIRVLRPEVWSALAEAMHAPAVMPFRPAYQIKHVDAADAHPLRFEPEEVSYLGDYREGVLPHAASVEWVRIMTWWLVPNQRYAKYSKWRHEGPSRRRSCEAELRAMLAGLHVPFTPDGTGCFVVSAFSQRRLEE